MREPAPTRRTCRSVPARAQRGRRMSCERAAARRRRVARSCCFLVSTGLVALAFPAAATTVTNFEAQQIHPLALSVDGSRLFAVNTPDSRLTVFAVTAAGLTLEAEIPVGLEPVSVRPRTPDEVWVVNHLSDTISIVDLNSMNVRATLSVGDEPTDVVFAGSAGRAFVCVSQEDAIKIYDPTAPATPPVVVPLFGSDPRALATSPDGSHVYAAIFESGNRTSILSAQEVVAGGGPPPPSPPMLGTLPPAPSVGLIVYWNGAHWVDETGTTEWESVLPIPYTLPDDDVAMLDADTPVPTPSYFTSVGTLNYNLTVNPVTGLIYVPNLESFNLTRFEPNLAGRFAMNRITQIDPNSGSVTPVSLNPHINYAVSPGPPAEVALSLSQANGGCWDAAGDNLYLAALGSGTLAVVNRAGTVTARVAVGEGPTAAVVDDARDRVYVLDRFTNSVTLVSTVNLAITGSVGLGFNPEPAAITAGRRFLYDARLSAHGDLACASCHPFANFDNLSWDLGAPEGALTPSGQPGIPSFHPMKGPMSTQSLRGLAGTEPLHWRGDRADFSRFNPAFVSLMGRADTLSTADMQKFTDFILTVAYPPNPNQNPDRSYPDPDAPAGSAERGRVQFMQVPHEGQTRCQTCHDSQPPGEPFRVAPGMVPVLIPAAARMESQAFKVPHLRNMYEKTGFVEAAGPQKRGFGFSPDGSADTLVRFLMSPLFQFSNNQQRVDLEAFMLAFDTGMAPAVGVQVTVDATNQNDAAVDNLIALLISRAAAGDVDLVVKGRLGTMARGWLLQAGAFVSDRLSEAPLAEPDLRALAATGNEFTYTAVPPGNGERLGLDRDGDSWRDRDELDAGTDPADPNSFPGSSAVREPDPRPDPLTATLGRPAANPASTRGTSIAFTINEPADANVQVFDARGRLVRTLLARSRQQGTVSLDWNGTSDNGTPVPSGVYFYRLEVHNSTTRPMVRSERVVLAR